MLRPHLTGKMPSVVPKGIGGTLGYAPSGVSIEMAGPARFRTTALLVGDNTFAAGRLLDDAWDDPLTE